MLVGSAAADASVVAIKKVVATSERKTEDGRDIARYAFDGIDYPGVYTSWCTADGEGQGGELTVTFMADERIDGISIDVGAGAEVRALDVVSGDQVWRAVPVKGRADAKLGVTTRSTTLPSPTLGHDAVVAELDRGLAGTRLALTGNYFAGLAIEDCVARSKAEWTRVAT